MREEVMDLKEGGILEGEKRRENFVIISQNEPPQKATSV